MESGEDKHVVDQDIYWYFFWCQLLWSTDVQRFYYPKWCHVFLCHAFSWLFLTFAESQDLLISLCKFQGCVWPRWALHGLQMILETTTHLVLKWLKWQLRPSRASPKHRRCKWWGNAWDIPLERHLSYMATTLRDESIVSSSRDWLRTASTTTLCMEIPQIAPGVSRPCPPRRGQQVRQGTVRILAIPLSLGSSVILVKPSIQSKRSDIWMQTKTFASSCMLVTCLMPIPMLLDGTATDWRWNRWLHGCSGWFALAIMRLRATTTLDRISNPMKPGLLCQRFSKQSFLLLMSRLDANILIPRYRTQGMIVRLQLSLVSTTGGTLSMPSMLDRHESFRSIASRQAHLLLNFSAPLVPGRSKDCSIDLECRRM